MPFAPVVEIAWFGDSHTAGDALTGMVRRELAALWGDAGRGYVAAGKPPTKHYYQRDVLSGVRGGWQVEIGGKRGAREPFGLGGMRLVGGAHAVGAWVETCSACAVGHDVSRFVLHVWKQRDGAKLRYRVDRGQWLTFATATRATEAAHWQALTIDAGALGSHRLSLERVGPGKLATLGVVLEAERAGVRLHSLGLVGRRAAQLAGFDWTVIGEQLASRAPALVVLQYGTNEADDPDVTPVQVGQHFDKLIALVRRATPDASILVLGPPDLGRRLDAAACRTWRPCGGAVFSAPAAAGDAATAATGGAAVSSTNSVPTPLVLVSPCERRTPAILLAINQAIASAAARNGVAYFDTLAVMGGVDRMAGWVVSAPPHAFADHTHLTKKGYERWGALLLLGLAAHAPVPLASSWPTATWLNMSALPAAAVSDTAPAP